MTEPSTRISLHGMRLIAWRDGRQLASVALTPQAALALLADLAMALARQQGRLSIEREGDGQ